MLTYIAGSGAMGCRMGYNLFKAGNEVIFLDSWDEHIKAVQENGLKITGDTEDVAKVTMMRPEEATKEADLIIVLVKAMYLPSMLEKLKGIIGENTKVLCLLNGLGHEDVISKFVPEKNVLLGVTIWLATLKGPGHAHLEGDGTIFFKSLDPSGREKAQEVAKMLDDAGLKCTYDDDVMPLIWRKAAVNATMNGTCALLDCIIRDLFASEGGLKIVDAIIDEAVAVAKADGVHIEREVMAGYVKESSEVAAHHYPSLHQDLVQKNRKTEIDFINGAIVRKGQKHGIPTPVNEAIVNLVHAKEDVLKAQ